jgi:hypothetical protein
VNLRKFHLVFIACASALAFVFGAWALQSSELEGAARLATGIGAFTVALALVGYEVWFARYSRRAP